MQVYLKAIGCRLNEAELESWAAEFRRRGHALTTDACAADLMVFNSCAVTREAERKSRQHIRRLHRDNPRAKLVVSGCYATLAEPEAAQRLGVDLVVGNQRKPSLVEISVRELDLPALSAAATEPGEAALFARGRQRAFVKIQDGCRWRCTYCIVTVARGEERSRPAAEIIEEINTLTERGIREVVLTGVHVGGYGSDLGVSLTQLLRAILAHTDIQRLRLASVEPWDLPPDFFDLFAQSRLMPHLHLPLQSGSDTVLRRMARRCKTADFRRLVARARAAVAGFNVTTDVIVGFPGESQHEWAQTVAFCEEIGFGHMHIFGFSPRTGTKAARLPGAVDAATRQARSRELHALARRHKQATLHEHLGRSVHVLYEGTGEPLPDGARRYRGYTPNWLRVAVDVPAGTQLTNQIRNTRLYALGDDGEHLRGVLDEAATHPAP